MGNNGARPLPQSHHRAGTPSLREASVGCSQLASSISGRRDRHPRCEPDLQEQLNQNRGLEVYQPDLSDRFNEQRDQARPMGYPPVMPAIPVDFPTNDPMAATYARVVADVRALQANQEQARAGQAYAEDSD